MPNTTKPAPPMQDTINNANAAASTLFLGHNGDWWDFWLIVTLVLTAIVAIGVGVTTAGSLITHKREALAANVALTTFKSKTAGEIAEANARQKEAELKLEQLRNFSGQRRVDREILKNELQGKPKAPVAIWYLPDSSDGYWFATGLFADLQTCGWQADFPIPIPDIDDQTVEKIMPGGPRLLSMLRANPRAVNAGGQPSGMTVVGDGISGDTDAPDTPFKALLNALAKSTFFGVYGSGASQFMPVPKGTLRIVISAKPDPIFIPDTKTK
jgi:hypothetical protein